MDLRAKQFYDRAVKSAEYNERVLCLNNAFFVLYGKEFSKKASQVCSMSEKDFLDAVEYCREDSDSRRLVFTEEQLKKMTDYLAQIFK